MMINIMHLKRKEKVVGFFLCNPDKYNKIQDIFENFDYFEYDGEWKNLDEVGIGILKNNILRNKGLKSLPLFKTGRIWGYSFKEEKTKHVFKIVDEKYPSYYDNEPGKVIGDKGFPMLSLLQEYMNNFNSESVENYTKYRNLMMKTLDENVKKQNKSKIIKNVKAFIEDEDDMGLLKYLYKKLRNLGGQKIITNFFITKMYEYSSENFEIY